MSSYRLRVKDFYWHLMTINMGTLITQEKSLFHLNYKMPKLLKTG